MQVYNHEWRPSEIREAEPHDGRGGDRQDSIDPVGR